MTSSSSQHLVTVEQVTQWLRGDLALQHLVGDFGERHGVDRLSEAERLDMLAEDFEYMVAHGEIPTTEPDDNVITVFRRMEAASAGARAERDIMRAAVEEIAGMTVWSEYTAERAHRRAQKALIEDRARRQANLAALSRDESSGTER